MHATDVVAYAYEAAFHCPECAAKRFDGKQDSPDTKDNAGNPVHAVFASNDGWSRECCDDCREYLNPEYQRMLDQTEFFYQDANDFANADPDSWQAERLAESNSTPTELAGWYYWTCLPGCMPDSDASGPFATEEEASAECANESDL